MRTTDYATRLNNMIERLKVRRDVLANANLLSHAAVSAIPEIRAAVAELEVLAIDLMNAQRQEGVRHRKGIA